ncbi:unnamed protein product [Urochloa humidicola]
MVVLFLGNKEDKGASFHLWDGEDDIAMPSHSDDDDESQRPMPSDSDDDDELDRPMKLQRGLVALAYCYLLAFFQHVLAFVVRKWPTLVRQVGQHPLISSPGNGEGAIATDSASVDENKGPFSSKDDAAATPRFMPSLQVLHFCARERAICNHRYCNNLGLEYLPSLREFSVEIRVPRDGSGAEVDKLEAALRPKEKEKTAMSSSQQLL